MTSKEQDKLNITRLRSRCSIRYNFIIFPLRLQNFLNSLIAIGYKPMTQLPPIPKSDLILQGEGQIAQRENFIIDFSTEKQFVGISGIEPDLVVEEFKQILLILEENKLSLDNALFYEFQAHYSCKSNKDFLIKLKQVTSKCELLKIASKSFETNMSVFSLKLFDSRNIPNSPDYFEITLQPDIVTPSEEMNIVFIYRNCNQATYKEFLKSYEKNLENFLNTLCK